MKKILVFGQYCRERQSKKRNGCDEKRSECDSEWLVFGENMLIDISCPHLEDRGHIVGRLTCSHDSQSLFAEDMPDTKRRIAGKIVGDFMFVPDEGHGHQHMASGFEHPAQLVEDLGEIEDVFENFARKDTVKRVVGEGQRLAVIVDVDILVAVVVAAYLDIRADIFRHLKKAFVGLAPAAEIQ